MASNIAATTSQFLATQLEQVNTKFPEWLVKTESNFSKLFQKAADKHQISAWAAGTVGSGGVAAYRIPVLLWLGGDYQVVNLDGGDLGTGSQPNTAFMTVGDFTTDIAYQIPLRAIMVTKTNKQAIANALTKTVSAGVGETAVYNEIGLFGDAVGLLATADGTTSQSGISGGKVTYALEKTKFGPNRLRGMNTLVDVYDGSNALAFSGARVDSIDFSLSAPKVTLKGVATYTPANTDSIAFPAMGSGSYTAAAGSFRNGIYTFNRTTFTTSVCGLAYTSAPEMKCILVDLANGAYTPSALFSAKSQLIQRRDEKALTGMVGVCHMSMRTSWYNAGITIANQFLRPGDSAKNIDLAGQGTKYSDTFEAGEVTHYVNRYAEKDRVDWLVPSNFGYVQLDEPGFVQTPDGQRMFIGRNTTTGNPAAGLQWYLHNTRNYYSVDPGCAVVFYNGKIPDGQ